MAKYRKRPVIIDAEQFLPNTVHKLQLPEGVMGVPSPNADNWAYGGCTFYILTLEGRMNVVDGDWIIKGVKSEYYSCKPDIFQTTYELFVDRDSSRAG